MRTSPTSSDRRDPRRGMALVTTLGILAALMAMGLAFLFLGRTERVAAHNVRQRETARHHIDAALDIAMQAVIDYQTDAMGAYDYTDIWEASTYSNTEGECDPPRGSDTTAHLVHPQCIGSYPDDSIPTNVVRLGRPAITNWLPSAVWDQATNTWSSWVNIIGVPDEYDDECTITVTNGRVAYLAIDCSGFLDVHGITSNHVAVFRDYFGTDVGDGFDLGDAETTDDGESSDEAASRRPSFSFLSQPDLNSRGRDWGFDTPVSNLVACLFDPGPNATVTNWSNIGNRQIELIPKYDISPWRGDSDQKDSCLDYGDPALPDWLDTVTNRLGLCGFDYDESTRIAWNLLNFMDADRIPQAWDSEGSEIEDAWRRGWPVEDVPLINEFALVCESSETNAEEAVDHWNGPSTTDIVNKRQLSPESWTNYSYRTAVELWYPFAPREVTSEDMAGLTVGVYTNTVPTTDSDIVDADICFGFDDDEHRSALRDLEFDPADEETVFQVFTNPVPDEVGISFPVYDAAITNIWRELVPGESDNGIPITTSLWHTNFEQVTMLLPLGQGSYTRYVDPSNAVETAYDNTMRVLARVSIGDNSYTNWVDEAPCIDSMPVFDGATNHWNLTVDDPRRNGDSAAWSWNEDATDEDDADTLGTTNANCTAWNAPYGQGLPLIHFDGPLRTAGDIGHVASLDAWRSVCLANTNWITTTDASAVMTEGNVLDYFTTSPTNRPVYGMMSYGTPWTNVIRAVMADIPISESRGSTNQVAAIDAENGEELVDWMTDCFLEARDTTITDGASIGKFTPSTYGEVAFALGLTETFADGPSGYGALDTGDLWQPATNRLDDVLKEDFIRGLAERVSFRQRLYVVVLAAQALAPNGRIASDQRAIATIAADLFTGQWRVLNWAWLE